MLIESKIGQRLVGLALLVGGGGVTAWLWHSALTEGRYSPRAAAFFPAFAVCGLGALLWPMDYPALRARHGVQKINKFYQYPAEWKALTLVAVAAGLGNWWAMSQL